MVCLPKQAGAATVELSDEPVEKLLDYYGRNVEQTVYARAADHEKDEVCESVQMRVLVVGSLAHNVVAEPDGGEGDETEIDGLKIRPVLHRVIHRRGAARDGDGSEEQYKHDPVDGRFPRIEPAVRVVVLGGLRAGPAARVAAGRQLTLAAHLSLVHVAQHVGEERNYAFEEQVEEEKASGAAEKTVQDEHDFPGNRSRRRHAETCNTGNYSWHRCRTHVSVDTS